MAERTNKVFSKYLNSLVGCLLLMKTPNDPDTIREPKKEK